MTRLERRNKTKWLKLMKKRGVYMMLWNGLKCRVLGMKVWSVEVWGANHA